MDASFTKLLGLLTGVCVFLLPVIFVRLWTRRHPLKMAPFFWGLIMWTVFSGLGWSASHYFRESLDGILGHVFPAEWKLFQGDVSVALIYAVVETSLILWLALRPPYHASPWESVISFGLGYGALEGLIYGMVHMIVWVRPDLVPESSREVLLERSALSMGAPLVERLFTYLTHIYAILLVFYAVRCQGWWWLFLAFMYKFMFYGVIAVGWTLGAPQGSFENMMNLWTMELAVFAFGSLGLAGVLHMGYIYHRAGDGPGLDPEFPTSNAQDRIEAEATVLTKAGSPSNQNEEKPVPEKVEKAEKTEKV